MSRLNVDMETKSNSELSNTGCSWLIISGKTKDVHYCHNCGKMFSGYRYGKKSFCSTNCYKEKNKGRAASAFKTGLSMKDGYVIRTFPGGRWVYEHRYIVEQFANLTLPRSIVVHHKNKDRTDNRIENLEIMSRSAHTSKHRREAEARKKAFIKQHVLNATLLAGFQVIPSNIDGVPSNLSLS